MGRRPIPGGRTLAAVSERRGLWRTYPVQQIENDAHGDAKLFKVQVAIAVDVGEVPYARELVIPQAAVLEHWRGLLAREELAAVGACRKDVPVCLDLLRLDPWGSHGDCLGGGFWVSGRCRSGPTGGFATGEFEQPRPIDVEVRVRGYGSWDCWNCRVAVSALSAKAVWFGPSLLVVTTGCCCASPVMSEQRSRVLKSTATDKILAPGQSSKLTAQG